MLNGFDGVESEDGTLAGFDPGGVGEFAGGFDGFVFKWFEFFGIEGDDFDGTDLLAFDREDGIQFDGPAGGFATDGHDASEFALDREFVGLGAKSWGQAEEKNGEGCDETSEAHWDSPWTKMQGFYMKARTERRQ